MVPVCRHLVEDVSEWYALWFIVYKVTVGFSIIKVITGVFMHETFKVASTDDDLMILQKQRIMEKHAKKMRGFFEAADSGGEGSLTMHEFREVLSDPRVKTWLSAMELDVADTDTVFKLLDSPDEGNSELPTEITCEELVHGVAKLKGPARSLDMAVLMREVAEMRAEVRAHADGFAATSSTHMRANAEQPLGCGARSTAGAGDPALLVDAAAAAARESVAMRRALEGVNSQLAELMRRTEHTRVRSRSPVQTGGGSSQALR